MVPEAQDARAAGKAIVAVFMREALPNASEATRELAGELIKTTPTSTSLQAAEVIPDILNRTGHWRLARKMQVLRSGLGYDVS